MAAHDFARFADGPLRDARQDEAGDSTPWLLGNIDYPSAALGLGPEATDMEVAVDNFSADFMVTDACKADRIFEAVNRRSGSRV